MPVIVNLDSKCPICNSEVTEFRLKRDYDGKIFTHSNGERWETVMFECGLMVEYIPNFGREQIVSWSECANDPEIKARNKVQNDLIDSMVAMIAGSALPQSDKDSLVNAIAFKRRR